MRLLTILALLLSLCLAGPTEAAARQVVRTRTVVRGGGGGAAASVNVGVQRSTFVGRVGVAAGTVVVPPAHHFHRSFAFRSFFAPSYAYARSFAYAAPFAASYAAYSYPSASYAYPAASYSYPAASYSYAAPCPQTAPVYSAPACTCQQNAQAYAAPASGCPCVAELAQLSAQIAELRAAIGR